jgi:hypothetical protein
MQSNNPQHDVEAPVRRALLWLVVRGVVLVGVVLALVLAPRLPALAPLAYIDAAVAIVVSLLLFGLAGAALVERRVLGRPSDEARAGAWFRAREVEPADAMLALVVAGWVPVALLAGLVVLAWPNFTDPAAGTRAAWWAIGTPALGAAWLVAVAAWLETIRDVLARAVGDSERRFRSYWANPGA